MFWLPELLIQEPKEFPLPSSSVPDGPLERGFRLWFVFDWPDKPPPDEDVEPGLSDKPHPILKKWLNYTISINRVYISFFYKQQNVSLYFFSLPSGVFCPVAVRLLVWLLVVELLSQMVLPTLLELVTDVSPVVPPASAPLSSCPPMEPIKYFVN